MKKITTLLISLWMVIPLFAIVPGNYVSEDMAVGYVLEHNKGKDIDVYIADYSSTQWLVFVDLAPLKGWQHDCLYYYINKTKSSNGEFIASVYIKKLPPNIDLKPKSVKNRVTRAPQNIKVPKMSTNATNTNTYAVILSGGVNKFANHERYWNDCSFIYQTLVNKYRIPKNNIYVIMGDGTNPAEDMRCTDGRTYESSPLDLDFDGSPDLKYAATKSNVMGIFGELSRKLTSNNHLFFFVIDHGGTHDNNTRSYINLWGNDVLEDYELSTMLNKINAGAMNIVLGQCYSGGFIDNIAKKGRVISTASTGKESSWGCRDIPYDEFVYQWTSSVAGRDAYNRIISADVDKNGHVTMDEAFQYAKAKDREFENPMYNSTPLSVGEDLAFDKLPALVDLYIKDNMEDTGKEPNLTTDNSWNSPDVWVRNKDDGGTEHENPYYTADHPSTFIKVKITNRGTKDYKYKEQPQYLHTYWAKASTGLTLNAWRGKELYNGYVTGFPMQPNLINQDIPAGESAILTVVWALPYELLGPKSDNDTEHHHFCLFARVSKDYKDTDEDIYLKYNAVDILRSKKLAQKNLSIIQKSVSKDLLSTVFVRNTMNVTRNYTLEVRPHTTADRSLFDIAKVDMVLSKPILSAWRRGGSKSAMVAYSPALNPTTLQLQSADSKVQGINLGKNEFEKISLSCNFSNSNLMYIKKYTIDLIQRDEATGEIIGGETFIIDPANLGTLPPIIIKPNVLNAGQYQLTAESPDNLSNYTWTDKAGNIIGNSKEVIVSPTNRNNEYIVRGTEGGVMQQASIKLEQIQGIKSVSPNPADTYIDVILKTPIDNEVTSIKVQSVSDNNTIEKQILKNNSQVRIELDNMPKGILVIQLISGNEIIDNAKVIKN